MTNKYNFPKDKLIKNALRQYILFYIQPKKDLSLQETYLPTQYIGNYLRKKILIGL